MEPVSVAILLVQTLGWVWESALGCVTVRSAAMG